MLQKANCLSIEDFIAQAPEWHRKYREVDERRGREGKPTVNETEALIQEGRSKGYLEIGAIEAVVNWGGSPRLLGKIRRNHHEHIRHYTSQAIEALDKPIDALRHVMRINGLAESFGSKVLAFLSPESCPILDSIVRGCLGKACNWDNESATYGDFISLCEYIGTQLPPEWEGRQKNGIWYIRDIEMALFQFAIAWRDEGPPRNYITGTLPI